MPEEQAKHKLAVKLARIVHEEADNVPHDIGLKLVDAIDFPPTHAALLEALKAAKDEIEALEVFAEPCGCEKNTYVAKLVAAAIQLAEGEE